LFGGNVEASTKGNEIPTEIREDWWGNSLIFADRNKKQFNSETEKTLNNTALNSSGRIKIERAINQDLNDFKSICDIKVSVSILGVNKLKISIFLQKPNSKQDKVMQIIWDSAKTEIILQNII
jgi:hypothetical protein